MSGIHDIYLAGRVRRWHANADLAGTDDRVDGHAGRVARLLLKLHPDASAELLAAALTHDDGEVRAGDMPYPAKVARPELVEVIEEIESDWRATLWARGCAIDDPVWRCSPVEVRWLRFADRLDGWCWAMSHVPSLVHRLDWQRDWAWLAQEALQLGCREQLRALEASMFNIGEAVA